MPWLWRGWLTSSSRCGFVSLARVDCFWRATDWSLKPETWQSHFNTVNTYRSQFAAPVELWYAIIIWIVLRVMYKKVNYTKVDEYPQMYQKLCFILVEKVMFYLNRVKYLQMQMCVVRRSIYFFNLSINVFRYAEFMKSLRLPWKRSAPKTWRNNVVRLLDATAMKWQQTKIVI